MLKAVKTNTQSNSRILELSERRIALEDKLEETRVNLQINELIIQALKEDERNVDKYDALMGGYLSEREFIDTLEGVSISLRYHLALAFLDAHNLKGA